MHGEKKLLNNIEERETLYRTSTEAEARWKSESNKLTEKLIFWCIVALLR